MQLLHVCTYLNKFKVRIWLLDRNMYIETHACCLSTLSCSHVSTEYLQFPQDINKTCRNNSVMIMQHNEDYYLVKIYWVPIRNNLSFSYFWKSTFFLLTISSLLIGVISRSLLAKKIQMYANCAYSVNSPIY